ncbi:MAG: RepB family plasmid replication initiator protein [Alteromonadaceae bacterium]|nr:RepB family plasmid replication initiator protein [Alteromonadaceae bacterium]
MMEVQQLQLLETGTLLTEQINVNSLTTAQSLALLRLGLFTPTTRNAPESAKKFRGLDVTEEFRTLEISKREGFTDISIIGLKLNVETDFKIWCGIIRAFNSHGYYDKGILFKFTEFAKLCGFKSKQLDKKLRKRIESSLVRLRSQTIKFSKSDIDKSHIGGLISSASFDTNRDLIHIVPDASLWELYQIDHIVLLKLEAINKLQRMETAQCLYLFISALPQNPFPISFERLRKRLLLTTRSIKEQNRTITNAINKLIDIGYLKGQILPKESSSGVKERYLLIEARSQKLLLN